MPSAPSCCRARPPRARSPTPCCRCSTRTARRRGVSAPVSRKCGSGSAPRGRRTAWRSWPRSCCGEAALGRAARGRDRTRARPIAGRDLAHPCARRRAPVGAAEGAAAVRVRAMAQSHSALAVPPPARGRRAAHQPAPRRRLPGGSGPALGLPLGARLHQPGRRCRTARHRAGAAGGRGGGGDARRAARPRRAGATRRGGRGAARGRPLASDRRPAVLSVVAPHVGPHVYPQALRHGGGRVRPGGGGRRGQGGAAPGDDGRRGRPPRGDAPGMRRHSFHRLARWLWQSRGLPARTVRGVLLPLSVLYGAVVWVRAVLYRVGLLTAQPLPLPAVAVGNRAVGGAGQTPPPAWIATFYATRGRGPGILLRGYGGDETRVHERLVPGAVV